MDLNSVKNSLKKGITKEEFLDNYSRLVVGDSNSDSYNTVDNTNIAAAIFDQIDTNPDGKIDEKEYNALMNIDLHDGEDGKNILSDKDILGIYQKMADDIQKTYEGKTPEAAYNAAQKNNISDESFLTQVSFQIDVLNELIDARSKTAEETIKKLKSRIENLVKSAKNVNTKLKEEYVKDSIKKQEFERQAKIYEEKAKISKQKVDTVEHWISLVNTEIADIEKTGKHEDKKKAKQEELKDLEEELKIYTQSYNSNVSSQNSYIKKAKEINSSSKLDKIKSKDKETAKKIKEFEDKIELEKQNAAKDISNYKDQIKQLEEIQDYVVEKMHPFGDDNFVDYFGEEDTSGVITSDLSDSEVKALAKPLAEKWRKKYSNARNLSDAFYEGVVKVASNVKCDPNALLGLMMSECGLDPKAQNKSSGATGLIQFMPSTARNMFNMSTAQIKNMSAEQQLGLVQKYLQKTKSSAGFKQDDILSAGTLYTLVFLPAYAKRELLTVRGEKFYNANAGLDVDGDNKITKKDMAQRVLKFI